MVDNFTVALQFESEGIPRTVADVKKITSQVEEVRKQNELAAKSAQILAEAYELTEQEIRQVQRALVKLSKDQERAAKAASREAEKFQREFERAAKSQERAAKAAADEAARSREQFEATAAVVSTGLAVGIGAFFQQSIEQFRQFEQFESILTNALGSPEAAEEALGLIEQFASTTPFQLDEVVESFIKLQNRGISPTTEQLRQLGDIAASQGKSLDQITEAILDAQTGEFERLKEFGIQASAQGDQVAIAFRDANLEVERTPEAIADAILSLGDLEGVAGGMAAQAETLTGRLSNLGDETSKAGVAFGEFANNGVRPVVEGAILLVQSFNSLPAPLQAVVIGTTALSGALAAAVAAITAYNLANGQRIAQEALAAASAIRNTAATVAQGAALQVAAAAQATYATLTGRATVAQAAQTAALLGAATTLAAVAGAIGSIALAADSFRSVTAEADDLKSTADELRGSFEAIEGDSPLDSVSTSIEQASERLNVFQRTLDTLIRGPIPGLATAAEASANQTSIAFNEVVAATDDIRLAAAQTANALEDGIAIDASEVEGTVASIDAAITALQQLEQTTPEATARIEAQVDALTEYRERIVATDEGITSLADSTDDLKNRLDSLNSTLNSGQLAIQQAGTEATAALEQQRAAGVVSAEEYQSQLANIERAGYDDRINLATEKLLELQRLEEAATDDEVVAQIQKEILKTQLSIDKDRIASARTRVEEIERLEQAEKEAAEKAAKEKRDAAIKAAKEETDALKKERAEQERIATEAFNTQQRQQSDSFDEQERLASTQFDTQQRVAEEQFNDRQRDEKQRFEDDLRASSAAFEDSQRTTQRQFEDSQRSDQKRFNDQQRSAEQAFQNKINAERQQGNAEFDVLDQEVDNRVALIQASSREERKAIEERIEAEKEAAEIRRDVEADVLRDRNSVLADADTDLSPLEQARADFEAGLQAKEAEFQQQQQLAAEEFETNQRAADQDFEDGQRLAKQTFDEEQRQAELTFQDGQRQTEAEFQDQQRLAQSIFEDDQRGLQSAFEDAQRLAEAAFKDNQRTLDENSATEIKRILDSANAVGGVEARREGGAVKPGQPYLVGEDGPELIFPNRSGYVATAGQTAKILGSARSFSLPAISGGDLSSVEKKLDQLIKVAQGNSRPRISAGGNIYNISSQSDPTATAQKLMLDQIRSLV